MYLFSFSFFAGDHTLNGHDVKTIYTRRGSNVTIACEPASRTAKTYNLQWFKDDRKLVEVSKSSSVLATEYCKPKNK